MCWPAYGNYVVLESATPICRNRYCFTKIGTEARSLTARTRPSQSCSASERSQAVSDREAGEKPRGGMEMKRRTSDRAPFRYVLLARVIDPGVLMIRYGRIRLHPCRPSLQAWF